MRQLTKSFTIWYALIISQTSQCLRRYSDYLHSWSLHSSHKLRQTLTLYQYTLSTSHTTCTWQTVTQCYLPYLYLLFPLSFQLNLILIHLRCSHYLPYLKRLHTFFWWQNVIIHIGYFYCPTEHLFIIIIYFIQIIFCYYY